MLHLLDQTVIAFLDRSLEYQVVLLQLAFILGDQVRLLEFKIGHFLSALRRP
jgi:hypothetical protein